MDFSKILTVFWCIPMLRVTMQHLISILQGMDSSHFLIESLTNQLYLGASYVDEAKSTVNILVSKHLFSPLVLSKIFISL